MTIDRKAIAEAVSVYKERVVLKELLDLQNAADELVQLARQTRKLDVESNMLGGYGKSVRAVQSACELEQIYDFAMFTGTGCSNTPVCELLNFRVGYERVS